MTSKIDLSSVALEGKGLFHNENLQLGPTTEAMIPDQQSSHLHETVTVPIGSRRNPVKLFQEKTSNAVRSNARLIGRVLGLVFLIGYTVYFAFAIKYSVQGATALIVITSLVVAWRIYTFFRDTFGKRIYTGCFGPVMRFGSRTWPYTRWIIIPALLISIILALSLWIVRDVNQLQSLVGIVFFMVWLFATSKYPDKIHWRPVLWGFSLQFAMALFVLRYKPGFEAIKWLSDQITTFINYSMDGAATVFGDPFLFLHPFAFVAMPMLIYIGAVMSILYYIGVTQIIAAKIGWFVEVTMATTAIESLSVGANIFLNGMDTMLMLRNYLPVLTRSEFHCFLVGNHSTVAGFAFALFVMFGAPPQHLLSATVMSAPAAIAVSKLNYPETEESMTKFAKDITLNKGDETNIFEAGANGASVAGKTVAAVLVNFIGFLSILAFINAALSWLGGRVGYTELSFQVICSYLFFLLALAMGIEIGECKEVAKLLGVKVFVSELFAYQELGTAIDAGLSVSILYDPDISPGERNTEGQWIMDLIGLIPDYRDILNLLPSV